MEGIVQHFVSERNDLRSKLQESENTLTEERAQGFKLEAEAKAVKTLAQYWEGDNQRLREDSKALREENKVLRERIRALEETLKADWLRLQEQLILVSVSLPLQHALTKI
jgi:predicted nuclease with TOPRIM domain